LTSVVKRSGLEVEHSRPSSAEVKKEWTPLPHTPSGVYRDILIAVINSSQILAAVRVNVGSVLWFGTQGQP
jgi:hypothetical protein